MSTDTPMLKLDERPTLDMPKKSEPQYLKWTDGRNWQPTSQMIVLIYSTNWPDLLNFENYAAL